MPDLTVIEGRGQGRPPHDYEAEQAKYALQKLIIELLRALSRGDDYGSRVSDVMLEFWRSAGATQAPFRPMVHAVISDLHEEAMLDDNFSEGPDDCRKRIVQAAFRVAAEAMADDGAARARLSSRKRDLEDTIQAHLLARETRSRANGWSFTEELTTRHLGPWSPPPRPKVTAARKAPRKGRKLGK